MDDGKALLAAVIAHPDEDTPRLVYADYLEENGERERAEVVRLGVRYFRAREGMPGAVWPQRAYPRWAGSLAGIDGAKWLWCRGFIEHVFLTAADWLKYADAVTAAHPVRRVTLTTTPPSGRAGVGVRYLRSLQMKGPDGAPTGPVLTTFRLEGDSREVTVTDLPLLNNREPWPFHTEDLYARRWEGIAFELPQATAANFHAITGQMVADAVAAQFQDPPLGRSVKDESAR